jgi:hypothetical protein
MSLPLVGKSPVANSLQTQFATFATHVGWSFQHFREGQRRLDRDVVGVAQCLGTAL